MDAARRDHLEALKRFNQWENEQLRGRPADYARALEWLSDAWELAGRLGTPEAPEVRRERHLRELLDLKAALVRAHLTT